MDYKTDDLGDGYKGRPKFEDTSGTLVFAPDETIKTVTVKILDNDLYEPTFEFTMTLSNPGNCELGLYLYRCRVKIIDNDIFPSNFGDIFPSEIEDIRCTKSTSTTALQWTYRGKPLPSVPPLRLFIEYVYWVANKGFEISKFEFKFWRARTCELVRARSRLYRSRFLQVNTRWKALAEIYTMHSFAPFSWDPSGIRNIRK